TGSSDDRGPGSMDRAGVLPTLCPCFSLLVLPRVLLSDEDNVAVSPHVLRQTCLRLRAAHHRHPPTPAKPPATSATVTSAATSHPTRSRSRTRWRRWQGRPRLYWSRNMVASCVPPLASARAAAVAPTIECRVVKVKRPSLVLLEPRLSPFPSLHTGPTL